MSVNGKCNGALSAVARSRLQRVGIPRTNTPTFGSVGHTESRTHDPRRHRRSRSLWKRLYRVCSATPERLASTAPLVPMNGRVLGDADLGGRRRGSAMASSGLARLET